MSNLLLLVLVFGLFGIWIYAVANDDYYRDAGGKVWSLM